MTKNAWLNSFALLAVALAIVLIVVKNLEPEVHRQSLNISYNSIRDPGQ
jgi:hypothetical protein